jgi:hypothetical protein
MDGLDVGSEVDTVAAHPVKHPWFQKPFGKLKYYFGGWWGRLKTQGKRILKEEDEPQRTRRARRKKRKNFCLCSVSFVSSVV